MISHFLNLEWKQYFRSSYWQRSIGLKILMGFFGIYLIFTFLGLGLMLFEVVEKFFPEQDVFLVVNQYVFYWILGDLMTRFFLQKLPVMSVKPLLLLPIKRSKVINYVLGKSVLSFFNFLPLFAIIPFGLRLIGEGYETAQISIWMLVLIVFTLINNFLNFIIESATSKTDLAFLPLLAVVSILSALNHFDIISFGSLLGSAVVGITNTPALIIILVLILIGLYYGNYKILRSNLFLDSAVQTKVEDAKTSDLSWTNRFGDIAPFMQLDLKMLMRNKRTKSTLPLMILSLFLGMMIYPNPEYQGKVSMFVFVGIFTTGMFLINYGQFIPAWDSAYYRMLMTQNFKYERFLKSKFMLMAISVVVLFVLTIPYVYFGWEILVAHLAVTIYNIGVNTFVIMYGGSFNRKKINLDQKAAFNYQGTGAVQWIIGIPLMIIPMAIFSVVNQFLGFSMAALMLMMLGGIGIVFHEKIMKAITNKYIADKYAMIHGFSQEN